MVGAVGVSLPQTRETFLLLCPIQLVVTAIGLILLHPGEKGKFWLFLIPAALIGWSVEALGVATGLIFGQYAYGAPLGPPVLGVPLVIGLNWVILSYCVSNLVSPLPYSIWGRSLMAGLLLTGFDALMEPGAIKLGLWTWSSGQIDKLNYPAWFVTGSMLAAWYFRIVEKNSPRHTNPAAGAVLIIQILFFWLVLHLG